MIDTGVLVEVRSISGQRNDRPTPVFIRAVSAPFEIITVEIRTSEPSSYIARRYTFYRRRCAVIQKWNLMTTPLNHGPVGPYVG